MQHTIIVTFIDNVNNNPPPALTVSTSSIIHRFSNILELKRHICKQGKLNEDYVRLIGIEPSNFNNGYMNIHYTQQGIIILAENPITKLPIGTPQQLPTAITCVITNTPRHYFYEGDLEGVTALTFF
jgi:hypothetical protein